LERSNRENREIWVIPVCPIEKTKNSSILAKSSNRADQILIIRTKHTNLTPAIITLIHLGFLWKYSDGA